MRTVVYPGSFDPPTYGHLDIIKRALLLFDEVIVAVLDNTTKKCMFSVEDRVIMLKKMTSDLKKVRIEKFNGLLVNYVNEKKAEAVIRGLRVVSDFEYEFQMAQMNRELNSKVETIFMMTSPKYAYLSSTIVKEILNLGGNIKNFVPQEIEKIIKKKIRGEK